MFVFYTVYVLRLQSDIGKGQKDRARSELLLRIAVVPIGHYIHTLCFDIYNIYNIYMIYKHLHMYTQKMHLFKYLKRFRKSI